MRTMSGAKMYVRLYTAFREIIVHVLQDSTQPYPFPGKITILWRANNLEACLAGHNIW